MAVSFSKTDMLLSLGPWQILKNGMLASILTPPIFLKNKHVNFRFSKIYAYKHIYVQVLTPGEKVGWFRCFRASKREASGDASSAEASPGSRKHEMRPPAEVQSLVSFQSRYTMTTYATLVAIQPFRGFHNDCFTSHHWPQFGLC